MKVCLMNDSFPPVIDGVVNVMMNYADHLMEDHQARVIVATPNYPGTDYSKYPYPVVPYQSLDTSRKTSGYRTGNPFSKKAVSALADFEPDIIHTHCPASSTIIARMLRDQTEAPVILTYHTKYDIDIQRVAKVRSIASEAIRLMVSNIEACDEIWTVSKGAGESLKALGFRGDYRVMNNGVDFEKGRVGDQAVLEATRNYDLPAGIPVFLFVGRLMTYKGLPLILDALKILHENGLDFRMVFVGKGPDGELLQNRAKELGIFSKCIFVGPIYDRNVLRAWNTRADLFLFPSTFDTNGLVVREAAACGLASVLIRDSCAAEGVTDSVNGFLIEENPQSMAAMLMRISSDLPALKTAGQHAMDDLYLSWKDCVSIAYDRYQVILEEKAGGRLPERPRIPSDYLISIASYELEEAEKLSQIRQEFFHNFRETASGMMENVHEFGRGSLSDLKETASDMMENVQEFGRESLSDLREGARELKETLQDLRRKP